ncbi:MAG: hypothetical protein HFH41_09575 [Lachnospiraceae bacterium]|nr:hypothetical protein [Lachnospiraceae bacterium]
MKIAFINGSPEQGNSVSKRILEEMQAYFSEKYDCEKFHFYSGSFPGRDQMFQRMMFCEIWLFALPVEENRIPAHMEGLLEEWESLLKGRGNSRKIYAVSECGAYDGRQNKEVLEILENWCMQTESCWGQGIGLGAGGVLLSMEEIPMGQGPKKDLGKALEELAGHIKEGETGENLYLGINVSRFFCRSAAEYGWQFQRELEG